MAHCRLSYIPSRLQLPPSQPPLPAQSQFCPLHFVLHHLREQLVRFGGKLGPGRLWGWGVEVLMSGRDWVVWEPVPTAARGHMPASWSALS